jgi:putative ATP-dependent endonuclease of OLD family
MQLTRLQVTNFRGISQIDLALDEIATALFGENNWGKTSLIVALCRCLTAPTPVASLFTQEDFHRIANSRASIARRLNITLYFQGNTPSSDYEPLCFYPTRNSDSSSLIPTLALRFMAERFGHREIRARRFFVDADGTEIEHGQSDVLADGLIKLHPVLRFRDMQLTDWLEHPRLSNQPQPEDPQLPASDAVRTVFERILTVPHQLHPQELRQGLAAMQQLLSENASLVQPDAPTQRLAEQIATAPLNFRDDDSLLEIANRSGSNLRRVALLMLIGALLHARGEQALSGEASPILVMEDPETHLHPIQLAMIWGLIEQLPLQKIITTNHGDLLASFPQHALRRLVRWPNHVHVYQLAANALSISDARKVAFHIRSNRASSMFARVWLLVEGETEFWLLPELARICGVNFPLEGIRCVEFAQAGLAPLIKFADHLGIHWHVICDGDEAGQKYLQRAQKLLRERAQERHITVLPSRDIEHYLWEHGFDSVYRQAASNLKTPMSPQHAAALALQTPVIYSDEEIIARALRYHSKPGMALEIAEAAELKGRDSIPQQLQAMFSTLQVLSNTLPDY